MPDEENHTLDDDELELPEEDEFEERRRQRQRADLPDRATTSPLLRRIIVGGGGENPKELGGQELGKDAPPPKLQSLRQGTPRSLRQATRQAQSSEPRQPLELPPMDLQPVVESAGPSAGDPLPETAEGIGELPVGLPDREIAPPDDPSPAVDLPKPSPPPEPWMQERSAPAAQTANPSPTGPRHRQRRRKQGEAHFNEETWSGNAGSTLWWWISAGIVCVGFVSGLIWLKFMRPEASTAGLDPVRTPFDTSIESTPIVDFVTDSEALAKQLDEIVKRFEAGGEDPDILRGGAASAAKLRAWRTRFPAPEPVHFGHARSLNAMAINQFGFVVVKGKRKDFSPFSFYFVKEGEEMRLDWEASEGFSEILPQEVPTLTDREPRMMRTMINGSNFYTDTFPEERYQCYTLQHMDPSEYVWAYAERESEADFKLRLRVLQRTPWGNQRRAVVKVRRGPEGSRPNQVEVLDLLHGDWIVPSVTEPDGARGHDNSTD